MGLQFTARNQLKNQQNIAHVFVMLSGEYVLAEKTAYNECSSYKFWLIIDGFFYFFCYGHVGCQLLDEVLPF